MRLAVNGFSDPDFLQRTAMAGVDIATSDVLWPFKRANEPGEPAQGASCDRRLIPANVSFTANHGR